MKKYKNISEWIEKEIPLIKEEYDITVGRKARSQAEKIAYLVGKSFLEHISNIISTAHIQSANIKIEGYVFQRAYEEGLRTSFKQNKKINIAAKNMQLKSTDKALERIIDILKNE